MLLHIQFASYLKLGRVGTPPALDIITSNGKFNWQNTDTVQSVANKLAGLADPGDASKLVMAGDTQASRVIQSYTDSGGKKINVNGIAALWRGFKEFNTQTVDYVKNLPDGDAKTNAKRMLDFSENTLLKATYDLRSASSQQKLYDEMSKKFSTGKFDEVYKYTDSEGKTKYYDPIKWNAPKTTIWGKQFQRIDLQATINDNPQMLLNNDDLLNKVKAHKAIFDTDGKPPGTGKGLLNWDPRFPTSNSNHQFIIDEQRKIGQAYLGACK